MKWYVATRASVNMAPYDFQRALAVAKQLQPLKPLITTSRERALATPKLPRRDWS